MIRNFAERAPIQLLLTPKIKTPPPPPWTLSGVVWSWVMAPRANWKGYLRLSLVSCPIVGLYQNAIIVPTLPFTLPQIYFIVKLRTPIDDPPTELQLRIERPGDVPPYLVDQTELVRKLPEQKAYSEPEARFAEVTLTGRISPFELKNEGIIRVFSQ